MGTYDDKTPVVMIHPASRAAYELFDSNEWAKEDSKAIVQSCAAQYGLIHYTTVALEQLFINADKLCQPNLNELNDQWKMAKWPLKKLYYLVEIQEAHLYIQAFLGSIKTFLDLIVQLISSEGVVSKKIHGFHKRGQNVGGEVMDILHTKATSSKAPLSIQIMKLIESHKSLWIDQVVNIRDSLTHPKRGMSQVMFELKLDAEGGDLKLLKVKKPKVNNTNFNEYAKEIIKNIEIFSKEFLSVIKNA